MTRHISQAAERSPVPHVMRSAVRLLCSKDSSASGDTLVRKPSERDAADEKPTPIKPGHWQIAWRVLEPIHWPCGTIDDEGDYLCKDRWPSREIAEQNAEDRHAAMIDADPGLLGKIVPLGPVFFPADGEKP